jgi:hypothetical protein
MARTVILCLLVAVASFTAIIYFRLTPIWETAFRPNRVMMAIPILLLSIFFAAVLVAVANRREMDVIALMVAEGILAYLILGSLSSTSLVILICCAFVVYLHFAQRE